MLLLPEVFERTWGITAEPFWPAAIAQVRQLYPEFCFMAEVYWDLEWTLQHFLAGLDYQNNSNAGRHGKGTGAQILSYLSRGSWMTSDYWLRSTIRRIRRSATSSCLSRTSLTLVGSCRI